MHMSGEGKWSSAALCAHSDTLTPEQMEEIFGMRPSRSHRMGESRSTRARSGTHDRHFYSIHSTTSDSEPLSSHIEELLSVLEPRVERLKRLSGEASLRLFCGFSSGNGQGGFSLSPELLSRLARLGIEVVFDLYPPEGAS